MNMKILPRKFQWEPDHFGNYDISKIKMLFSSHSQFRYEVTSDRMELFFDLGYEYRRWSPRYKPPGGISTESVWCDTIYNYLNDERGYSNNLKSSRQIAEIHFSNFISNLIEIYNSDKFNNLWYDWCGDRTLLNLTKGIFKKNTELAFHIDYRDKKPGLLLFKDVDMSISDTMPIEFWLFDEPENEYWYFLWEDDGKLKTKDNLKKNDKENRLDISKQKCKEYLGELINYMINMMSEMPLSEQFYSIEKIDNRILKSSN